MYGYLELNFYMESGDVHSPSIEMGGGFHFRYLDIDLNTGSGTVGEPNKALLKKFIGWKGLGPALLCELDKSCDPFDPEHPMIFLTGPLTATKMTTSTRACLVTRSPLTGGFLDSHAGGHFGNAIRGAGYDYIIIRGKAEKPIYIKITREGIEIEDAGDLWGKGSFETEDILMDRHLQTRVASIGPAGENKVRFACINTDKYRQFGRGGAGAVMGSKYLKALVFEGHDKIPLHDEQKSRDLVVGMNKETVKHPDRILQHKLGTPMWVRLAHE
jgi:aldehyde:ferredoxin oxidoreductase